MWYRNESRLVPVFWGLPAIGPVNKHYMEHKLQCTAQGFLTSERDIHIQGFVGGGLNVVTFTLSCYLNTIYHLSESDSENGFHFRINICASSLIGGLVQDLGCQD